MRLIGLIDVDSRIPNLALMKISSYHTKAKVIQYFFPQQEKDLARYVDHKAVFKSVWWEEYKAN